MDVAKNGLLDRQTREKFPVNDSNVPLKASAADAPEPPPEFNGIKTIIIFAVIFGCFAAVYPRFLHPVVTSVYYGKSSAEKLGEEKFLPPKFQPGAMHPGNTARPRSNMQDRRTHDPSARFTGEGYVPESKSGLYFMLPLYTVGIIAFLLYTFYKVLSRQPAKCMLRPEKPENVRYCSARQQFVSSSAPIVADIDRITALLARESSECPDLPENQPKITEFQLQALEAKLKETEAQMNALIAQMAAVKAVEELVKTAERAAESDDGADDGELEQELARLVPGGISSGCGDGSVAAADDSDVDDNKGEERVLPEHTDQTAEQSL